MNHLWPQKVHFEPLRGFFGQKWRKQTPPKMANFGGASCLQFNGIILKGLCVKITDLRSSIRRCYVKEHFEFFWRAYGLQTEDVAWKNIFIGLKSSNGRCYAGLNFWF